jgi:hypothetical protein
MGTEWLALANGLLTVFVIIRNSGGQQRDLADRALVAIYTASNETRSYLASLQKGKTRNFEKEGDLSRLWAIASIPLRHFDEDLARRCELKGEYWRNPDEWTVTDISNARIGLDKVFRESKTLLLS